MTLINEWEKETNFQMESSYYNKGISKHSEESKAKPFPDYKTFETQFKQKIWRKPKGHNWLYSKYVSLKVVATIIGSNGVNIKNDQSRGNKAIDGMVGYAVSESKESAAYIKYGK